MPDRNSSVVGPQRPGGQDDNPPNSLTIPGMGTFPYPSTGSTGTVPDNGGFSIGHTLDTLAPAIVGGTSAVVGGPAGMALAGPAAGGTRALLDRIEGKDFDPTSVGVEAGANTLPALLSMIFRGGFRPAMTAAGNASGQARNLVGGILAPMLKLLGRDAPETIEGARMGGGVIHSGTAPLSTEGQTQILQRSVNLENAAGMRATPLTNKLDAIVDAIRTGQPVPADALDALKAAGLQPAQITDMIGRRIAAVGHGTVGVADTQIRK